jgi:hypothetical protein
MDYGCWFWKKVGGLQNQGFIKNHGRSINQTRMSSEVSKVRAYHEARV